MGQLYDEADEWFREGNMRKDDMRLRARLNLEAGGGETGVVGVGDAIELASD